MIYEYFEDLGRVLPVIDGGDPSPSDAESQEADRLEAAVKEKDPRVKLVPAGEAVPGCFRVVWLG